MVSEKEKKDCAQETVNKGHQVLTAISRGWPELNFQEAWNLWKQAEEALGYSTYEQATNLSFNATRKANGIVLEYAKRYFEEHKDLFDNGTVKAMATTLRDLERDFEEDHNLRQVGQICQKIVSRIDNEIHGLSQRAEQIRIEKEGLERVLKNLQQQVAGFNRTRRKPLETLLEMAGKTITQFPSHGQETKKFVNALEKFIGESNSFFCS